MKLDCILSCKRTVARCVLWLSAEFTVDDSVCSSFGMFFGRVFMVDLC